MRFCRDCIRIERPRCAFFLSYLLCALRCLAWIERGILYSKQKYFVRVESISCAMEEIVEVELCICSRIFAIRRITKCSMALAFIFWNSIRSPIRNGYMRLAHVNVKDQRIRANVFASSRLPHFSHLEIWLQIVTRSAQLTRCSVLGDDNNNATASISRVNGEQNNIQRTIENERARTAYASGNFLSQTPTDAHSLWNFIKRHKSASKSALATSCFLECVCVSVCSLSVCNRRICYFVFASSPPSSFLPLILFL